MRVRFLFFKTCLFIMGSPTIFNFWGERSMPEYLLPSCAWARYRGQCPRKGGKALFFLITIGRTSLCPMLALSCARFLWARIVSFPLVYSASKPSEIHYSPDRAMTERWASDEREKKMPIFWPKTNKNHIFMPQNLHMSKKSCIFTPDWVHCATRAYNKVSIQKDSIYAGLLWAGGLEGNLVHIEKAFIDALLLTNKKLRTLFTIPVRNKVSDCAYGYDIYQPRTLEHCTLYIVTLYISWVCHIGVGFIVVY